jgi:hypothetical protein
VPASIGASMTTIDPDLSDKVDKLREDLDHLSHKQRADMQHTDQELDKKADKADLADLENRLMQQLNDLLG